MSPILALAGLITIGLLVPRLTSVRWPRGRTLEVLVAAGGPLVVLGLVLGPGIDFLDRPALRALAPATGLAIGWIGASLGARFEWRYVRRIPRSAWLLAALSSLAALVVVTVVAWLSTRLVPALALAWAPRLPAILALGAVAAASGPGVVALLLRARGIAPRAARPIIRAALLETVCAVLVMTVPIGLERRGTALSWVVWATLAIGTGALSGTVFSWLVRPQLVGAELAFVVLVTLLFGAGLGAAAGVTPFVTCFLAGVVIVNASSRRHAVRAVLARGERPTSVVLLVVAGALLALPTAWMFLAALLLFASRAVAKWLAVRYGRPPLGLVRLSRDWGLGTIAQGGAVVALGVSYALLYGREGAPLLTSIVLLVAAAQLAAPPLLALALRADSRAPALTETAAPAELSANVPMELPR
ncbi:MAG TPA: cation:proton antiporter [Gemmatimonadales bacterium]|nr:cation:proton antiporter [Gemmatimonadales bacterium]